MEIEGHDPVNLADAAGDEGAGVSLAMHQLESYKTLLSNPCEFPNVKSLTFRVRMAEGWKSSRLDSLEMDENEVKPGSTLHAVIGLRNYRGTASAVAVAVPIPGGFAGFGSAVFRGGRGRGAGDG